MMKICKNEYCNKAGEKQPFSSFSPLRGGFTTRCKKCLTDDQKARRAKSFRRPFLPPAQKQTILLAINTEKEKVLQKNVKATVREMGAVSSDDSCVVYAKEYKQACESTVRTLEATMKSVEIDNFPRDSAIEAVAQNGYVL